MSPPIVYTPVGVRTVTPRGTAFLGFESTYVLFDLAMPPQGIHYGFAMFFCLKVLLVAKLHAFLALRSCSVLSSLLV